MLIRILLIVSAILLLVYMLKKIRVAKLKIEYTLFWIAFSSFLVLMGVFPKLFYMISRVIGFKSPISMVYLLIIFVLIVKMFLMTLQISQLENKIDSLAQQIAIDRKIDKDEKIGNIYKGEKRDYTDKEEKIGYFDKDEKDSYNDKDEKAAGPDR